MKIGPFAALLAIAAAALVIPPTAVAAEHESIGFCLENVGILCPTAKLIDPPAGGSLLILAKTAKAKFANAAFFAAAEECESAATTKTTETMNNPISGTVEALSFAMCVGPCRKVEARGLPWNGELTMAALGGVWTLHSNEGQLRFSECTFGTECEYRAPVMGGVTLSGENVAAGAVTKAVNVNLEYAGGSGAFVCGAALTANAEYKAVAIHLKNSKEVDVGLHEPWWYTLLGKVNARE